MGRIFPMSFALVGAIMVSQSVVAADLVPPPLIAKAPPLTLWGGPYAGANLGYGWGSWDSTGSLAGRPVAPSPDVDGVFGGIQAGYNWQFDRFVLGIEGDFQLSGISGSSDVYTPATPGTCSSVTAKCSSATQQCTPGSPAMSASSDWDLNWFSTVRGRAGYIIDNRWLAYVTAGAVIADVDQSGTLASGNRVKAGWTAGGGIEQSFARNWTAKAEYLYLDLGSETFQGSTRNAALTSRLQEHVVRIGVNYHFTPDPIVLAKR